MEERVLVVEHQCDASLGYVGERLAAAGIQIEIVGPESGKALPESLDGYTGLIVLGGYMGPTDDEVAPWLPGTRALLRAAVELEVATLGICLGAQLLAAATGGIVQNMQNGPEIGLQSVNFTSLASGDPIFSELADTSQQAVQWHWLEISALPADTTVLATSAACPNQAFRVGSNAWGVQFHPEALSATVQGWADSDSQQLVDLQLDSATIVTQVREAEPEHVNSCASLRNYNASTIRRSAVPSR